jgi:hypothetical protein
VETGSKIEASQLLFDQEALKECAQPVLLAELSLEQFKACLLDKDRNLILGWLVVDHAHMPNPFVHANKLEKIFEEFKTELISSRQFFSVVNQQSSLVPTEFYDPLNEKAVLEFAHEILSSDTAQADHLEELDAYNVWSCPDPLRRAIIKHFPEAEVRHFSSPLLKHFVHRMKDHKGLRMFGHVQKEHLELLCFEDSKLLLYNSFRFQSPEDFLYYTLFGMEQCRMDPEEHHVELMGSVRKADPNFKMCYTYIRNVQVRQQLKDIKLAPGLRTSDHQEHFNLFNLHHCVS